MKAIAQGFYVPHHFILNSEVPRCIFVFPPLPLSVPWGCEKDSSSFRIFLLKYGTCVCRNHFLGRVSIFIALFFASPSVFLQILFQRKKRREIRSKTIAFFFLPLFYLKIEKQLSFFRKFLLTRKWVQFSEVDELFEVDEFLTSTWVFELDEFLKSRWVFWTRWVFEK